MKLFLELFLVFLFGDGACDRRLAVSDQPVEVHADMGGFYRSVGKRDSAIKHLCRVLGV